ncbi:MAG TPA: peptidyl-prolyl cis-trans isomerase, partial [Myxococcota bacterium]|nr:peptidyl-prolyl cis-trans isomerase [Myxococcota bacterium]
LVPELDRVVFGLQVGQVSAPIQVETGVFVVRLQDLESSAADFESVKGQLQEQVFEARMTEEQERWFQQARGKASIRILLPE